MTKYDIAFSILLKAHFFTPDLGKSSWLEGSRMARGRGLNRSRPAGERHDLIGKRDRFGQIVGDKEDRFLVRAPDFQELGGRCLRFLYG